MDKLLKPSLTMGVHGLNTLRYNTHWRLATSFLA